MISDYLHRAAADGSVPGAVAMAGTADRTLFAHAAGTRGPGPYTPTAPPMALDTLFRLRSMTKALTAAAAMQQVEQGRLSLDQEIGEMIPELAHPTILEGFDAAGRPKLRPARRKITLRHLLTHTAGLTYDNWNPQTLRYLDATGTPLIGSGKRAALSTPLAFEPGTDWQYSIGIDFAGLAVEAVTGLSLDEYFHTHLTGPLGMHHTGFLPSPENFARLATLHQRGPDGALTALAPENPPSRPEFFGGGGGLYGTAPDYLRFLQMLLGGGTLDGVRVLRPDTVARMTQNHIGALSVHPMRTARPAVSHDFDAFPGMRKTWGLSFLINTEPGPNGRSPGSLAWAGLCNTYYWLDPVRGVAGVLMTQILPFGDPVVLDLLGAVERGVYAT